MTKLQRRPEYKLSFNDKEVVPYKGVGDSSNPLCGTCCQMIPLISSLVEVVQYERGLYTIPLFNGRRVLFSVPGEQVNGLVSSGRALYLSLWERTTIETSQLLLTK